MVLVLMVSISSLAFADEDVEDHIVDLELEEETQNGENETEDSNTNETEEADGNETEIDDDTEKEIEIMMNNNLGAEIRLLQLEKSITKNLLKGERAVTVLEAMGYNISGLNATLDEMRLLLEEVQAANASADDAVQQFVDLKSDARKLTKQFRETIKELLSGEKIKELKEQIKDIVGEELQNYSKKIRNRIKQFNRNQIHRLYEIIGEVNNSLADEYQNGSMSIKQVKSQMCETVNVMTKEKRNQIFSEMKKEKIQKKNNANVEAGNATVNFEEREQTRLNNRLQKVGNTDNTQLKQQIQSKIVAKNNNGKGPISSIGKGNSK